MMAEMLLFGSPDAPTWSGHSTRLTVSVVCRGLTALARGRLAWATDAGTAGGAAGACSNRLSSTLLAILVTPSPPPLPFLAGGFLGGGFLGAASQTQSETRFLQQESRLLPSGGV